MINEVLDGTGQLQQQRIHFQQTVRMDGEGLRFYKVQDVADVENKHA